MDLLGLDGTGLTQRPYEERRTLLEELDRKGRTGTSPRYSTTGVLCTTPCASWASRVGGIAKRTTSRYGANRRGWVKVKNPNYWRRDLEREAMRRSRDRRAPTRVYCRMGARSILEPVQLWAAS